MKILIAHFRIQDYGGIINYSENLASGLKENGHVVLPVMLTNKGVTNWDIPASSKRGEDGWEYGEGLGLWYHQVKGWYKMPTFNYETADDVDPFDTFDLIIYMIPCPTVSKQTKGYNGWVDMFSCLDVKQIAIVHDANLPNLYPHIMSVIKEDELDNGIDGLVCVHDAAYSSAKQVPIRRKFIPNPHNLGAVRMRPLEPKQRIDGIVSVQIFKKWKNVDKFVRLVPALDDLTEKVLCGKGIEYYYMTSEDKCKDIYKYLDGRRIWDVALEFGMEYKGPVDNDQRTALLCSYKLFIDYSWSKVHQSQGALFNRSTVEAMIQGCVPILVEESMQDSKYFKPWINYLPISIHDSASRVGSLVEHWLTDTELLERIQVANFILVEKFDRKEIAKQFIDFAFSDDGEGGKPTIQFLDRAEKKLKHFYE